MKIFMFRSRNKDNAEVANFHERTRVFLAEEKDIPKIENQFNSFVEQGVKGETSRLYVSVNHRNMDRLRKKLIAELAMNDQIGLEKIERVTVGLAMEADCAAEKHWLFDIDTKIPEEVIEIRGAINEIMAKLPQDKRPEIIAWTETPNGFHLIVEHGFDTRELMAAYSEKVSLKRDDFTILKWLTKS